MDYPPVWHMDYLDPHRFLEFSPIMIDWIVRCHLDLPGRRHPPSLSTGTHPDRKPVDPRYGSHGVDQLAGGYSHWQDLLSDLDYHPVIAENLAITVFPCLSV